MIKDFLPFSRPTISQEAIQEVVDCLNSGWITTGPRVAKFTEDLKQYLSAPHVLPLQSATAGLHLALLSLNLSKDDEVITTPLTFAATLNTIILAGAKPSLVDVDPETFNIDLNKLEDAINKNTKVIMPVHFAGLPVDLDGVYYLAKKYNLRVIEDAAHAIGAEYKNKKIGSFGDIQVFSFHPNKNMTTGEGGVVATKDAELAENIALLRFHGMDREAWQRFGKKGAQDYEIVAPGFKYNMMDMQAALGIHQLKELNSFIAKRTILADRYQEKLKSFAGFVLPGSPEYSHKHAWHLYTPLINEEFAELNRDSFMKNMKDQNIGTGLHYKPVHLYPYYKENFGFKNGDFPIAENIGSKIVSLPLFPTMTFQEQDYVIDTIDNIFTTKLENLKKAEHFI